MIKTINETFSNSGPWVGPLGSYERIEIGEITQKECEILDLSSPQVETLRCNLKNIDPRKLRLNCYYVLEYSGGAKETWLYKGLTRINKNFCFFSRPKN